MRKYLSCFGVKNRKCRAIYIPLPYCIKSVSESTVRICKRCKTEYEEDNGYPVCDYCLSLLDNWE